ncbi:hypothetical protein DW083_07035 [Parabacteroides sp. AF48-14]|nr:hypothetical protein DW083_07035 [Parabacteroides sp. AF48-14]
MVIKLYAFRNGLRTSSPLLSVEQAKTMKKVNSKSINFSDEIEKWPRGEVIVHSLIFTLFFPFSLFISYPPLSFGITETACLYTIPHQVLMDCTFIQVLMDCTFIRIKMYYQRTFIQIKQKRIYFLYYLCL